MSALVSSWEFIVQHTSQTQKKKCLHPAFRYQSGFLCSLHCYSSLHTLLKNFFFFNVMHLKEANMGLAHIVEAYIVITWSDFRSVYGDTLTKCIVATPGFMKMEMGFLFL